MAFDQEQIKWVPLDGGESGVALRIRDKKARAQLKEAAREEQSVRKKTQKGSCQFLNTLQRGRRFFTKRQ